MSILTQNLLMIYVGTIILGIIFSFFGYKFTKMLIALIGFLIAGVFGTLIGLDITNSQLTYSLIMGLSAAVVGMAILSVLYFLGFVILGSFLGLLLSLFFSSLFGLEVSFYLILFFGLATGILNLFFRRTITIISTSLTGAYLIGTGLYYFIFGNSLPVKFIYANFKEEPITLSFNFMIFIVVLFVFSFLAAKTQLNHTEVKRGIF